MITTLQEILNGLKRLNSTELLDVADAANAMIEDREREEKRNRKLIREQIIKEFHHFGYQIPDEGKFWKVNAPGRGFGGYGLEIGRYEHSCHIEDSEFIVLLVVNGSEHFTESYSDLWLKGPF